MQPDQSTRPAAAPQAPHQQQHGPEPAHEAEHIHLPPPTIWPVTMAFGLVVAFSGLVFIPIVSILGLLLVFLALVAWIQELRHESH